MLKSVVADLQLFGLRYVGVGDRLILLKVSRKNTHMITVVEKMNIRVSKAKCNEQSQTSTEKTSDCVLIIAENESSSSHNTLTRDVAGSSQTKQNSGPLDDNTGNANSFQSHHFLQNFGNT